ncbi:MULTISPECIES: hypothetical protein [unclassified Streptomyces]|uniref:hypothetical protein n=1 Tax=unclassified Streptomyces TaxID=2593676 RepID=UPI002E137D3A|nr:MULTISPECIES: hypothetical protein [unclassified Streptomyces]WSR29444.1 hypothetical protein OG573_43510 [Streptomyces sp. NBC_01205]
MPEDPIAHGRLAALTRRHEQAQDQNVREFGIIKRELTTDGAAWGLYEERCNSDHGRVHL